MYSTRKFVSLDIYDKQIDKRYNKSPSLNHTSGCVQMKDPQIKWFLPRHPPLPPDLGGP